MPRKAAKSTNNVYLLNRDRKVRTVPNKIELTRNFRYRIDLTQAQYSQACARAEEIVAGSSEPKPGDTVDRIAFYIHRGWFRHKDQTQQDVAIWMRDESHIEDFSYFGEIIDVQAEQRAFWDKVAKDRRERQESYERAEIEAQNRIDAERARLHKVFNETNDPFSVSDRALYNMAAQTHIFELPSEYVVGLRKIKRDLKLKASIRKKTTMGGTEYYSTDSYELMREFLKTFEPENFPFELKANMKDGRIVPCPDGFLSFLKREGVNFTPLSKQVFAGTDERPHVLLDRQLNKQWMVYVENLPDMVWGKKHTFVGYFDWQWLLDNLDKDATGYWDQVVCTDDDRSAALITLKFSDKFIPMFR